MAFLIAEGFIQQPEEYVPHRWYHLIHHHRCFKKSNHPTVYITEGTDESVVPIVVGTSSTAAMNVLTERTFYSFYPELTRRGWTLPNWPHKLKGEPSKYQDRGYTFLDRAPLTAKGNCSFACPVNPRRIRGRHHMGLHVWDLTRKEKKKLDENEFIWQLGTVCTNPGCRYRPIEKVRPRS